MNNHNPKKFDNIPKVPDGKRIPLVHSEKDKQLIREANQRIHRAQIEQAEAERRSANFIAL